MGKFVFKNVLRTQNKEADSLANKAVDRGAGMVKENQNIYEEPIP